MQAVLEAGALLGVAIVAVMAHEAAHYAVALATGDTPSLRITTDHAILPSPAVNVEPIRYTPTTFRVLNLAPLALCLPALAVGLSPWGPGLLTLGAGYDSAMLAMWVLGTVPSPPDWWNAYYASNLDTWHAVRNGDHPTHAAAEGY